MNNLIESLAAKANFGHIEHGEVAFDERLEAFAHYVILECIHVCDEHAARIMFYSQFGAESARDCAQLIRDHFLGEPNET